MCVLHSGTPQKDTLVYYFKFLLIAKNVLFIYLFLSAAILHPVDGVEKQRGELTALWWTSSADQRAWCCIVNLGRLNSVSKKKNEECDRINSVESQAEVHKQDSWISVGWFQALWSETTFIESSTDLLANW